MPAIGSSMELRKAFFAVVVGVITRLGADAQITLPFSREKQAFARMEEGQWRKAFVLLRQILERDSISVEGTFGLAEYFFNAGNPRQNLDSARIMADRARRLLGRADEDYREKLSRFPIDSTRISTRIHQIETETYRRVSPTYSIAGYQQFLTWYPQSIFGAEIIRLRDSVAYAVADRRNSSAGFREFMELYPSSTQLPQAKQRFDRLVFDEETRSGTIESFEAFAALHPENPWRESAIEKIFQSRTIDGQIKSFSDFEKRYPESRYAAVCRAINESRNLTIGSGRWLPFVENDRYGFISMEGRLLVDPVFENLPEEYHCPAGEFGIIRLPTGLYDRNGALLMSGEFRQATYLGVGFFLLSRKDKEAMQLLHSSGWEPVPGPIHEASIIGDQFLAVRQIGLWGIYGFNGSPLLPAVYDDIRFFPGKSSQSGLLILKRGPRYFLMYPSELPAFSRGKGVFRVADEITELPGERFLLRIGQLQEVIDHRLNIVVTPERQMVRSTPAGLQVSRNNHLSLPDWSGLRGIDFDRIDFREPWMRTSRAGRFSLYYVPDQQELVRQADSIWFDGRFAFARQGDSVRMLTPSRKGVTMGIGDQARFLYAQDSSLFLLVRRRTRLVLYDAVSGKELFQGAYLDIRPVNRNYFQVQLREKWGLVNAKGKELLPADYDAMLFQQGWFSLLREGKFGGYLPVENRFLKPVYEANLVVFSADLVAARKEGLWGFLAKNQKPERMEFKFESVRPVTDSLALVMDQGLWKLYDVYVRKIVLDGIQEWSLTEDAGQIRFRTKGLYGLCTLEGRVLAPAQYEELHGMSDDHRVLYLGIRPNSKGLVTAEYINELGLVVRRTRLSEDKVEGLLCLDW